MARKAPPGCTRAAGVALWSWNVDTDAITMDEPAYDLWEFPKTSRKLHSRYCPKTSIPPILRGSGRHCGYSRSSRGLRDRFSYSNRQRYSLDFRAGPRRRCRHSRSNHVRYLPGCHPTQAGRGSQRIARGRDEPRLKNLLTIATALTQMRSRSAATKEDMAQELTSRLIALGVPRTLFVRYPAEKAGTLLGDLISVLLAPYDEKGASVRIRVSVPKMNVGETSSTALALVIHELATNSAKYGALSLSKWHPGRLLQRPRGRSGGKVD